MKNPATRAYLRAVNRWRARRGWPPVAERQLQEKDTRWLTKRKPGARTTRLLPAVPPAPPKEGREK